MFYLYAGKEPREDKLLMTSTTIFPINFAIHEMLKQQPWCLTVYNGFNAVVTHNPVTFISEQTEN